MKRQPTTNSDESAPHTMNNSTPHMPSHAQSYTLKAQKGFTLVETLVAITVLLLAVAGPLTVVANMLLSANMIRDRVTAFYLAQEGIEAVRNLRDTSRLGGQSWDEWVASNNSCIDTLPGDTIDPPACGINPPQLDSLAIEPCATTLDLNNCVLRQDTAGLYRHNGTSPDSKFTREMFIQQQISNRDELSIQVRMSWTTGAVPQSFVLEGSIMNWP